MKRCLALGRPCPYAPLFALRSKWRALGEGLGEVFWEHLARHTVLPLLAELRLWSVRELVRVKIDRREVVPMGERRESRCSERAGVVQRAGAREDRRPRGGAHGGEEREPV